MRSEWTNLRYFSVRRSLARNSHDSPGGESDFVDRSVRVSGLMICCGRTRWVVCWPSLPQMAIESAGRSRRGLLAGLRSRGLRPDHFCGVDAPVGCLIGSLYPSIRPRAHPPRAALPLGAEAGDPYGSRFSPLVITTPPARQSRVFYWQPLPKIQLAIKKYLRPPVARASRPPSAGSDTRRCSCLRAGRLTLIRWIFCWQPLPLHSTSCTLCDPPGRAPDAAPSRRGAAGHSSRLVCSEQLPPASDAGRDGKQKTQRVRLEESSARSPPPAEGRNFTSLNRTLRGLRPTKRRRGMLSYFAPRAGKILFKSNSCF